MAEKAAPADYILLEALMPEHMAAEMRGGEPVRLQFATDGGKVLATVEGRIARVLPSSPDESKVADTRGLQIEVSLKVLRSVSDELRAPRDEASESSVFSSDAPVLLSRIISVPGQEGLPSHNSPPLRR